MGLFPTNAVNGQQVTNANGTTFEYDITDDKWFIVNTITISNLVYDEALWNANPDAASKDAIRDKIESMSTLITANTTEAEAVQAVEDTGLVLSASKTIDMDGTPADDTWTGIILLIDTTGCAVGDAVYVDGTNSVLPADADAIASMPAIGIVVAAGKVLTHGVYRDDSVLVLATASKVYVSTTPGDLTTTAPSGTGDIVQVFGITVGVDMIFVNPSLDWVEIT